MAVTNRGSILISTANDIGSSLVDVIGGEGYSPNEWAKKINICGIAAADIPTALDNIEESTPSGTDRGDISLDTGNAVGAVLNKKFNTARGFKPSEWASATSKLTELEVKTASGAIASFNDGADDVPIESATFEFSPNQDLNGQDAPYPPGGGKNRFSADEIYAHGFWNANGSWTNHESYYAYIIKADPETDYTYNAGFTGITTFLDSNGDYISGLNQGTGLASRTVTTPANCAYITASISITNLNGTQQIEKGSSSTAYVPYANICPITGYEGLTIYQTGKNLIDNSAAAWEDGNINTSGENTTGAGYVRTIGYYDIGGDMSYEISGISTPSQASYFRLFFYDETKTFISYKNYGSTPRKTPANARYMRIRNVVGADMSTLQIEYGSTATTYEAYKAKTPIVDSFGRTVYGGSRKTDGTLTETHSGIVHYAGLTGWTATSTPGVFYTSNAAAYRTSGELFCDKFEAVSPRASTSLGLNCISYNTNYTSLLLNTGDATIGDFIQTMTKIGGFDLVRPLATPNEYTLEEIDMGNSFYGGNNIYSDTNGDTTVAYRADIDLSAT